MAHDETGSDGSEWHQALGIDLNGETWGFLTRVDRSPKDDEAMIRTAYASAYHWSKAPQRTPANQARADWLISHVHVTLGRNEVALHHAELCLSQTEQAGLIDFDHAYAHEAMARALAAQARPDEARTHLDKAKAVRIADEEDRSIFEADLAAGPWLAM